MRYVLAVCVLLAGCKNAEQPPAEANDKNREIARLRAALDTAQKRDSDNPAAPTSAAKPSVANESATLSVASFKKDTLEDCATVVATTRRSPSQVSETLHIGPEQIAMMVLEDFLLSKAGGNTMLRRTKTDKTDANEYFTMLLQIPDSKRTEIAKLLSALSWPLKTMVPRLKKGELAKVDSCQFPNRLALATCTITSDGPSVSWRVDQQIFNVSTAVDSDVAFKFCLSIGGKWSAPEQSDPAVASERLRQHARKLQEVADPERLRQQMKKLQELAGDGN